MILLDWVWPGASSFQPTIVSLRDLQGSKLIESLPPAFQSPHEQLVLPISGRGRADLTQLLYSGCQECLETALETERKDPIWNSRSF